MELPLFTYATLLDESFTGGILERPVVAEPAILLDFELLKIQGFAFLTAFYAPGDTVRGRLYRDLTREDYARLDASEGVGEDLFQRIEATVVAAVEGTKGAPEPAHVYVLTEKTLRRYGAL